MVSVTTHPWPPISIRAVLPVGFAHLFELWFGVDVIKLISLIGLNDVIDLRGLVDLIDLIDLVDLIVLIGLSDLIQEGREREDIAGVAFSPRTI